MNPVFSYDRRIDPQHLFQDHLADSLYAAWYIRTGWVELSSAEGSFRVDPGHWVFLDPLLPRRQRFHPDTHLLSIRFEANWRNTGHVPPLLPPRCVTAEGIPRLLPLAEHVVLAMARADGPAEQAEAMAAFFQWAAEWHRARATIFPPDLRDERMSILLGVLAERGGLGVVPYAEMRRRAGVSRAQVDRLFRANLGLSPRQWMENRALVQAERFLLEPQASCKEIAARLRFTDASHFAKWFKRQTGASPSSRRPGPRAA